MNDEEKLQMWQDWLGFAIKTWPEAETALVATSIALGPTSPITSEDIARAIAANE